MICVRSERVIMWLNKCVLRTRPPAISKPQGDIDIRRREIFCIFEKCSCSFCRRVRAVQAADPDKPGDAAAVLCERVLLGLVGPAGARLCQQQETGGRTHRAEVRDLYCSAYRSDNTYCENKIRPLVSGLPRWGAFSKYMMARLTIPKAITCMISAHSH